MPLEIISRRSSHGEQRPPLMFIHGAYVGAWCWDEHFLQFFAEHGYDAHAVSLRGHGRSEGRESLDRASLEDYVADVVIAAGRLDRPPVLVGHSMGAVVAQRAAKRCKATGLVLMAPVPPHGLSSSAFLLAMRDPQLFFGIAAMQAAADWNAASAKVKHWLFSARMSDGEAAGYLKRMQHESQRALADLAWPQYFWIRDSVGLPALVLGGADDALFPVAMLSETALVHGVVPVVIPDMAHAMMLEDDWKVAAQSMLEWLSARQW